MEQYKELSKTYDPSSFEDRLYAEWCEKGYFTPDVKNSAGARARRDATGHPHPLQENAGL